MIQQFNWFIRKTQLDTFVNTDYRAYSMDYKITIDILHTPSTDAGSI